MVFSSNKQHDILKFGRKNENPLEVKFWLHEKVWQTLRHKVLRNHSQNQNTYSNQKQDGYNTWSDENNFKILFSASVCYFTCKNRIKGLVQNTPLVKHSCGSIKLYYLKNQMAQWNKRHYKVSRTSTTPR